MVCPVLKHLYVQRMTARAATLPFPFLFFDKIAISTETYKINEKENKNGRASELDNMNESNTFSVFLPARPSR